MMFEARMDIVEKALSYMLSKNIARVQQELKQHHGMNLPERYVAELLFGLVTNGRAVQDGSTCGYRRVLRARI
jgi:hypothetical protein